MKRSILLSGLIAAAAVVGLADFAVAQRGAESKAAGQYNFYGNSASRSMRGAREYSYDYRQYVQSTPQQQVDPELAREASDAIGTYIAKAQRHMAWMRKNAGDNKETLASLDIIDKNLAAAKKSHNEMHDACMKSHVDGSVCTDCCQKIDESLATAIAEHDKLMKRLGLPNPTPTTKK